MMVKRYFVNIEPSASRVAACSPSKHWRAPGSHLCARPSWVAPLESDG
jgi:hypothetical protein